MMKRPQFLSLAGAAAVSGALPVRAAAAPLSEGAWDELRRQVGGNLIRVDFPLARCKANPDSAECKALFDNLHNPFFIGDSPALTQTLGWVDAWTTSPSIYAVAARNAQDVAAAVAFARRHGIRLAVKGGGHSYQGTSNAPESLLIWTRHMNGIEVGDDSVTLGAGVIWLHAYDAVTTKRGRYVQGGGCTTVGVAGLVQSGGFGSFSKHYGSAASSLLEAEVVTADGSIRICNARTNPDLFWALKGGGGGTFGVITKLTLALHDLPPYFGGAGARIKASSDGAYRDLIRQFVAFYASRLFNEHWGEQAAFTPENALEISMVFQGLDTQQAQAIWKPFLDWVKASPQYTFEGAQYVAAGPARHWWDVAFMNAHAPGVFTTDPRPGAAPGDAWWAGDGGQAGQFLYAYESLWLPQTLLKTNEQPRLIAALFDASRSARVALHFNKGLAGAPAAAVDAARDTATNPALLDAFALAISADGEGPAYPGITGHEPDAAAARKSKAAVHACMNALRAVAPAGGAYVSESNFFESGWQRSYWGSNYPRLASIKAKYDPDGLFTVHNGVRAT